MKSIYYPALKRLWPIAKFLWQHWRRDVKRGAYEDPSFDRDGYPSDWTLKKIEEWPFPFIGLTEFLQEAWTYPEYFKVSEPDSGAVEIVAATAGWSGNESLIMALRENHAFWAMCWQRSERGGRYIFTLPKESKSLHGPNCSMRSMDGPAKPCDCLKVGAEGGSQ